MSYIGQGLEYGRQEKYVYTATGGETSVTASDDSRNVSYSIGYVDVYLNGVRLISGSDFTATSGTSITGLSALTSGDVVEVVAHNVSSIIDAVSPTSGGTFYSNVTFAGNTNFSDTAFFADNVKLKFGDGEDLQIYHDGSNSYITENGTGQLILQGAAQVEIKSSAVDERMIVAKSQNSVDLYYDNSNKFQTTSTGVNVTGSVVCDGLQVDGQVTGQVYPNVVSVGSTGSDISLNFANGNFFTATATASITINNPSNMQPGQAGSIFLSQDGTGGHTISFASNWHFAGASHPTLTTTASATDRIDYVVYAANAVHAVASLDLRNA